MESISSCVHDRARNRSRDHFDCTQIIYITCRFAVLHEPQCMQTHKFALGCLKMGKEPISAKLMPKSYKVRRERAWRTHPLIPLPLPRPANSTALDKVQRSCADNSLSNFTSRIQRSEEINSRKQAGSRRSKISPLLYGRWCVYPLNYQCGQIGRACVVRLLNSSCVYISVASYRISKAQPTDNLTQTEIRITCIRVKARGGPTLSPGLHRPIKLQPSPASTPLTTHRSTLFDVPRAFIFLDFAYRSS